MTILGVRRTTILATIATIGVAGLGIASSSASPRHPAALAAPAASSKVSSLLGVSVVPKSSTAWAFGTHGTASKQSFYAITGSGKKWKSVAVKAPKGANLVSIAAGSAKDIWIVGSVTKGTKQTPLIMHSSGGAFSVEKTKIGSGQLVGVSASSATNAWAVGDDSSGTYQPYRIVKGKWKVVDLGPDISGLTFTSVSTSSPKNTWIDAVYPNGTTTAGVVYNGSIFSSYTANETGTFPAIATTGPKSTLLAGYVAGNINGKPVSVVGTEKFIFTPYAHFGAVQTPTVGKMSTFGAGITMVGSKAYLVGQTQTAAGADPLAEGLVKGKWKVEKSASQGKLSLLVSVASSSKVVVAVGSGNVNPASQSVPSGNGLLEVLHGKIWKAVKIPS